MTVGTSPCKAHIFIIMEIKLEEWQKKWLEKKGTISLRCHRKEGKAYFQAFELVEFMKTAEIGKKVNIASLKDCSTWERIE